MATNPKQDEARQWYDLLLKLNEVKDGSGNRPYSSFYLVIKAIFDVYPEYLDANDDFRLTEDDKKAMRYEINLDPASKNTKGVYAPFLDPSTAVKNADASLKSMLDYVKRHPKRKNTTAILYLTHGAQYCLWWKQEPKVASNEILSLFGFPSGTTHDVIYRAMLCACEVEEPVGPFTTPTHFQQLDLYLELLLSCPEISVETDTIQAWYNLTSFDTIRSWSSNSLTTLQEQKIHCKMLAFFLQCMRKTWPMPTQVVNINQQVEDAAIRLYTNYCRVTEWMCLPINGVTQLDTFDTMLKARTFARTDNLPSLQQFDMFSVENNVLTCTINRRTTSEEVNEDDRRHVLYRKDNVPTGWDGKEWVYALVPIFAKMFPAFATKEECMKICGYDCKPDETPKCVFNNDVQTMRQFSQSFEKAFQSLENAKAQCDVNCSDNIQGYNCINFQCVPSNDPNCTHNIATHGSLTEARRACERQCVNKGGFICPTNSLATYQGCQQVSAKPNNDQPFFGFQQYGSSAQAACERSSRTTCVASTYNPFQFSKIRQITGTECKEQGSSNLPKGMIVLSKPQQYLEFYFKPSRSALKGILLNHTAGSGKTIAAQAIISHFIDFPDNESLWNVLWVTKTGLLSQPRSDFYNQPTGKWRRAILTPTKDDVNKWRQGSGQWYYWNKQHERQCIDCCSAAYLPLNQQGGYDLSQDTKDKQELRYAISKFCADSKDLAKKQRWKLATRFNVWGGQVKRTLRDGVQKQFKALTYDSFVNLIRGKKDKENDSIMNKFHYRVQGRCRPDILEKTLIVIDEAHNMIVDTTEDDAKRDGILLFQQGRDGYNKVLEAFHNSYQTSLDKSCKVVLMSATPITKSPEQAIKLLHLIQQDPSRWIGTTPNGKLPSAANWEDELLDAQGKIEFDTKRKFLRLIGNNKISYYSGDTDPRYFAQKVWGDLSQYTASVAKPSLPDMDLHTRCISCPMSKRMVKHVRTHVDKCNTINDVMQLLLNTSVSVQQSRGRSMSENEAGVSLHKGKVDRYYLNKANYSKPFLKFFDAFDAKSKRDKESLAKRKKDAQDIVRDFHKTVTDPFLLLLDTLDAPFSTIGNATGPVVDANAYRVDDLYWTAFLLRYVEFGLWNVYRIKRTEPMAIDYFISTYLPRVQHLQVEEVKVAIQTLQPQLTNRWEYTFNVTLSSNQLQFS